MSVNLFAGTRVLQLRGILGEAKEHVVGVPSDMLDLFVKPPVSLLYFLSVILLSQAALLMALGQRLRSPSDERTVKRYAAASLGVMACWITLMVGAMVVLLS